VKKFFGNDLHGRIDNAKQQIEELVEIMRTGNYDEVHTQAVVSHDLWTWNTQLIILQKLAGTGSGQLDMIFGEPFVPQRVTKKNKTLIYDTPQSTTARELTSSNWGIEHGEG
jgi:hypothetical protein